MTTVTSIVFTGIGEIEVHQDQVDLPPLGANEVRIAPQYLGICGSDLHVLAGGHPFSQPPVVPGHEMVAEVVEVGPGVEGIAVGDHAVVDPIMACLTCRACLAGRYNLCEPPMVSGFRAPGFGRTLHTVPARNIHVAPTDIPWEVLAFAEPVTCAVHAVSRIRPEDLEDVLVIGAGTIGLSIVQALRIEGAGRITVSEPDPFKRELAVDLGAHEAVEPGTLPDDRRFTSVIDVVAATPTLNEACTRVFAGGTVLVMGVPSGPREIPLPPMQRFERDLISSGMYIPRDFDVAIGWLADGSFQTDRLVSDIYPINQAPAAYVRAAEADSIKTLIHLAN